MSIQKYSLLYLPIFVCDYLIVSLISFSQKCSILDVLSN